VEDAAMIDKLTEIAHLLDRHISTLLRRFSGRIPDAPRPARELVPPEVERRYRFALDNVHALHQECRLSSQVTVQALMVYEQKRHERFQFIAALLASVVLIPTLFASLFGVNFNVPAQNNKHGFLAFLVVIGVSGVVAYIALKRAQQRDWKLARRERIWLGIAAGIVVLAFVGLFAWLS
jgi:Mg2+ and Co2+ transporter CorA